MELAKIICERIKSVDLVRFTNSGTEATMNCIYASRAYTGRSYIAKVDGAYHGMYDSVAFNSGTNSLANVVFPEPGKPIIRIFFINFML